MIARKNVARLGGLFYLIVIATGLFAEIFVRQALIVPGDAIATAHHIQSAQMLYRLGFIADLINIIIGIPLDLVFLILFMPVNRNLTILAIFFAIPTNTIIAFNLLNQLSPSILLGTDQHLSSFQFQQLATLSLNALTMQSEGYAIGLVFFGIFCGIIGYLIYQSKFIPRILGILYAVTGVCYLLNSFISFLTPDFTNPLFPYLMPLAFIGEISLCLWLLIKGVRENDLTKNSVLK